MNDPTAYLSPRGVAILRGVPERTVRNAITDGTLPAEKVDTGGRASWIVKRPDAETWSPRSRGRPRAPLPA